MTVKLSGEKSDIIAKLRELALMLEQNEEIAPVIKLEDNDKNPVLLAETKKRLNMEPAKPRTPRAKPSPVEKAVELATALDAELRKVHGEVSGPAKIVLFDLIEPVCKIAKRLEWLDELLAE